MAASPYAGGNVHLTLPSGGCDSATAAATARVTIDRLDRKMNPALLSSATFPWRPTIGLTSGYYLARTKSGSCVSGYNYFVVLEGHGRHIGLAVGPPAQKPNDDNVDIYAVAISYGAVVGRLGPDESHPRLVSKYQAFVAVADVESDGWYYFDQVPPGAYDLEIRSGGETSGTPVDVEESSVVRLDMPRAKNVVISVPHSGCGAAARGETIELAIGRNGRSPGDGTVWPDIRPFPWHGSYALSTGYYSAEIAGKYCWEAFYPFVVLGGHERHLTLVPNSWAWDPKILDYDTYPVPYGAVVGHLRPGETRPRLRGLDEQRSHVNRWWNNYDAIVEPDGWFYFDRVFTGRYALETDLGGTTSGTILNVVENAVLRTGDPADYRSL